MKRPKQITGYTISNSNGKSDRAWQLEYPTVEAAAEAIRRAYGWDDVVTSASFTDDVMIDGDRVETSSCCAYATQEDCDRDPDGGRAPRITAIVEVAAPRYYRD